MNSRTWLLSPLFVMLALVAAQAETEVIFNRIGPEAIAVESEGRTRILSSGDTPAIEMSRGPDESPAPLPPLKPLVSSPAATKGRVLSPGTSGADGGKVLSPHLLLNEQQEHYMTASAPTEVSVAGVGDAEPARPGPRVSTEEVRALRQQLAESQQEAERWRRMMSQPVVIRLHNDILDLQWADAKQRIPVPDDGVVKLHLAPKE